MQGDSQEDRIDTIPGVGETFDFMGFLASISHSRQKLLLFLSSCLAFIAMGISQSMYGPFYPVLRAQFGLTAASVATITALHFTGATVAVAVSGFLSRRFGAFPVVITAATLLTVGYLGIAVSPTWALVLVSTTLLGLGFGGLVSLNFLIARVYPTYAASALSLLNALFSVGSMIGPVIASPFVGQNSYWPAFLIGGGVSAVVLLLFLLQAAPEEAGAQETIPLPRGFRALGEVSLFLLLYFFYVGSETSFSNWIPTHLTLTFDPAPAARLTSLFWVALTAGRLLAVPVGAKVRPSRILAGSITLAIAAAALAHYLPLAPAAYALAGLAMGPMFPVGLAWIATRFRDNSERVSSFVVAGGGIGGVIFPPMVGAVVDVAGRSSIPTSIGGLLLLAAGAIGGIFLLSRLHRSAPKS